MIRYLVFLSLFSLYLNAGITLEQISSKPTSRAKDFLIWQYLKQNISDKQAEKAYAQSTKKNYKLKKLYKKRSKDPYILYKKKCQKKRNLFSIDDKKCFKLALNPYKTLAMSNKQRVKLSKKVDSKNFIKLLKIQSEPYSTKAYEKYPADTILKMFINTTASHRRENLNIRLDKKFINKLASSNKIHYFIRMVIKNNSLFRLQKSLLLLDSPKLKAQDNFFLALHHLKFKDTKGAIKHLNAAYLKYKQAINIDKVNFWLYQISSKKRYLDRLVLSHDINIYTLYAHEKTKTKVKDYYFSLDTNGSASKIDIQDPFKWDKLRQKIKNTPQAKLAKLADSYKQSSMLAIQSYIIEKASSFKKHGYIMPYRKYLQGVSANEKAMVYAIMRQESNFIPSALSRSFALGLMQMMPFLVDAMSKQMKEKTTYKDMFKPEVSIRYAIAHIKWIEKSLYHPLFMAYGYNGGVNFFRKHLKTGAFSKGKYEPFLSMELMSNSESREYGKKVLANYVMYKKILGEPISIIHLFQTLTDPKKTDRFRAKT